MEDLNNATIIHETESFSRDHPLTNQVFQPNNNNTAPVAMTVDATGAGSVSEQVGVKRGRGRPKKNDGNGRIMVLLTPPPPPSGVSAQPLVGETSTTGKRGRGRPRGTGKLQIISAIGGIFAKTAVGTLIPHVMIVNTGEDVMSKIFSFFSSHKASICIISATGSVSNVIIRPPGASGGVVRYEGRFEILALSGSCNYTGGAGHTQQNVMLAISLAKPDGTVFGGGLQSTLIAAAPVQLVIGSFKQNINKKQKKDISGSPDGANVAIGNPNLMEGTSGFMQTTTSNEEPADDVFAATTVGVSDNAIVEDLNVDNASVYSV